ncbi:MAG: MFS transporter [Nocardioides sp.]|uniref:MFS transporter n=1 Tax=Nocardioides sp. TaxID=35761 RepID=UPI0039E6D4DF
MSEDSTLAREDTDRPWLSTGVLSVGLASLGSDSGHEMTTSLLPTFLSSTLHAGPGALGVIEGVSDALVGLSKLAGGPLSTSPARRGRLASGGYLATAVATGLIGLVTAVWQVAVLRALAWTSRGLRSPARDAMLMSLVDRSAYGRASGVERAGDNLGALIGPLLAAGLVGLIGVRHTLVLAAVPGLLAALAITAAAREAGRVVSAPAGREALSFHVGELRRAGLLRVLIAPGLFELGNLATTLLILRATDLLQSDGHSPSTATTIAILLYAGHNALAALSSVVAGFAADRFGPRLVFGVGSGAYVAAYALFAPTRHEIWLIALAFCLAGVGIGCAETAESTMVARALPDRLRGNGFGFLGLIQSFGDLGATLVAGLIWSLVSPTAAFVYAAGWMVLAVAATGITRNATRDTTEPTTSTPESD